MYKVDSVADYIIFYFDYQGYKITNPKLQSLLYLVQTEFISKKDRPCFDEKIEAWSHGPVVPSINAKYVSNLMTAIKSSKREGRMLKKDDKKFIREILDRYMSYSASDLNKLILKQSIFIEAQNSIDNEITKENISKYFKQ